MDVGSDYNGTGAGLGSRLHRTIQAIATIREEQSIDHGTQHTFPWFKRSPLCTQYSQSFWTQCVACLWKQNWSYWRNPSYTAVRFFFTTFIALIFGTIFWDLGSRRTRRQDLFNAMGSMHSAVLFIGIQNASSVQPVVGIERTVFYRERAAGMYSALPYAFAQRIPIWWSWYYWACPVAWTLYGLVVSQFGDYQDRLETGETVAEFVRDYFGFRREFLGIVAVMVVIFPGMFAVLFALSIKILNFQGR